MKTKFNTVLVPLMLTFFTMGFVDLVGIASNYVKADFCLSDTLANLLPSMVFFWFLILAVPTGMLMNKIGRKKSVLLSLVVTIPALILPLINYSFASMLVSFCFLGAGNALMQVSLNPLVASIVAEEKVPSTLTFGQFIKAIASFLAPILAAAAVTQVGDWRMFIFPIFGVIILLVTILLAMTKIDEPMAEKKVATIKECFALLGNRAILLLFLGIMAHVGIDVGINATAPRILGAVGLPLAEAGFATSWYFIFRTTGCLLGAYVLSRFTAKSVFATSVAMIMAGTIALFIHSETIIYIGIALIGLGNSNIFSVIFSQALTKQPDRNNEVSGLMITGVFGGAIFPLIMGMMSDLVGSQAGAVAIILACTMYLAVVVVPKIKG